MCRPVFAFLHLLRMVRIRGGRHVGGGQDGEVMLMWIGRSVDPGILSALFGVPAFEQMDSLQAEAVIGTRGDPLSTKVMNVLRQVRAERPVPFMQLKIVRCGEPTEPRFFASLIEDPRRGCGVGAGPTCISICVASLVACWVCRLASRCRFRQRGRAGCSAQIASQMCAEAGVRLWQLARCHHARPTTRKNVCLALFFGHFF